MNKELTLGSLFDGSGGFPLAAIFCEIKPIWSSEVEPFPIIVTQKNLPQVKHLGDIKDINGSEIEPVDIISFGSPCQDLSIAGKRAGLEGKKSNLFYEAIRVIKEMRCKSNGKYPRYLLWENVPGAFSSNKGEDFRCVLEEITRIKDSTVKLSRPSKWQSAGEILGDYFSLAWRVLDAKYFGVPQRRRRIFIVADLDGGSSREILFEQKSLSGNTSEGCEKGKRNTEAIKESFNKTICLNDQGGQRMDFYSDESGTLRASGGIAPFVFENHSQDSRYKGPLKETQTLASNLGQGGNNQPFVVYDIRQTSENTKNERHNIYECDVSRTIDTSGNTPTRNQGGVAIVEDTYSMSKNSYFTKADKNISSPLLATDYKDPPLVNQKLVRRLTPKECGRLQGFPDYWCDNLEIENPTDEDLTFWREVFDKDAEIKGLKKKKTNKQILKWLKNPHTDSAEYKMWGNGIALPCAIYIFKSLLNTANRA
ncbi:DNA (cytosine-5-)-methyltransferase [Streptococcus agalactiae]|uniref:DNA (cytosine-5-)-methyltransferase n=1 Tax=Streptococcus agalactiae TaxID=1311 RepID=UPI000810B15C|nr:DNA (cytosine-5-)-methyltransferase [Streptococcus agalactiae]OCL73160.1 DNA (cytosine-5-)-methyltransferase [Streptococcus agalactiae]OCM59816.1 DNA (cytosine-5-)-methyltransferase [Streptococcus agalactiae]OCM80763.1 DNA (cytosine-5-)-methyltransferase [Streptococcus agalactiae]OCM83026.1 DNA (cytosine-5-)-methyltransferase [Streptococcus agalactiae]